MFTRGYLGESRDFPPTGDHWCSFSAWYFRWRNRPLAERDFTFNFRLAMRNFDDACSIFKSSPSQVGLWRWLYHIQKKRRKKKHSTVVQKTPKNSLVSTCFNPVRVAMSTLWLLNLPIFDHSASRHSQLHAPQTSVKQNPWPLYRIWCIVTQKRPKTIVDRFLVGFWFCLSTFPLGQPRFGGADSDFRPMEPVPKRMDCHQQRCKVKKYPAKMVMWPAMLQINMMFLHKKLACRIHGLIHNQPSVHIKNQATCTTNPPIGAQTATVGPPKYLREAVTPPFLLNQMENYIYVIITDQNQLWWSMVFNNTYVIIWKML